MRLRYARADLQLRVFPTLNTIPTDSYTNNQSILFRGCVVNYCGLASEAQIKERCLRFLALMLVFVLIPKVGKESPSSGWWCPYAATAASTAMDAVAAALPMDHGE